MDVIKLAQSRIDDSIMLMFIDSAGTFNLDPDQIIYLRDLGLPAEIITGMIQHDIEIVSGLRQMPLSPSPSPATVHLNFVQSEPIEKPPQPLPPAPAPTLTAVTVAPLNSAPPLTPEGPRPDELTFSHQAELPTAPRMLSCQS